MARVTSVYSMDSSGLIHAWRRAYRPKNFGKLWQHIDSLISEGRLKATIEVLNELEKKDDELFSWAKERQNDMFVDIDADCQTEVSRLLGLYPQMVDTTKGKSGGDPFVIALASSAKPRMKVITEEHQGKFRIPHVCALERVDCINLADFISEENWEFK